MLMPFTQVWGSTCIVAGLFAYLFVPETRGLTLEQVDKMMDEVTALKSSKWRVHDTFMHEMNVTRLQHDTPSKTSP